MPKTQDSNRKMAKTEAHSVAYDTEMQRLIRESAYLLAEKDDFKESPVDYWLAAEKTIHAYF